jgi:hypothetical protein
VINHCKSIPLNETLIIQHCLQYQLLSLWYNQKCAEMCPWLDHSLGCILLTAASEENEGAQRAASQSVVTFIFLHKYSWHISGYIKNLLHVEFGHDLLCPIKCGEN